VIALTVPFARADDEARKVLDNAVKAHGGADLLKKLKDKSAHQTAKITVAAVNADVKMETFAGDDKFKHVINITVNGMDIKQEVCFDGKEFWIAINGKVFQTLKTEKELEPLKEAIYAEKVIGKAMLGDKSVECSFIGEGKVEDKPAMGVRLASKGHKDVSVWFDKKSGLMTKIENRGVDFMSGTEVAEEKIITDWKEVDGYKRPSKISVIRDGAKVVEIEISEIKLIDKLEDSTFTKPD
jgi:outer membrane lipoprotein-sorting protein